MGKQEAGTAMGKQEGGNKAARVAQKKAAKDEKDRDAKKAADVTVEEQWREGSKSSSARKLAQEARDAERQQRRAEVQKQEAEEAASAAAAPRVPMNAKASTKKARAPPQTPQLDDDAAEAPLAAISASGIDDALDALDLARDPDGQTHRIDTHLERRFPAAYAKFEERRLQEMKDDGSGQGLRLAQRRDRVRKEFERHPDNPRNQLGAQYNATQDELRGMKADHSAKLADRLSAD